MTLETLKIRQQYHHYTRAELADLVARTFEQRDENVDAAWRTWLIEYCLVQIRPRTLIANSKDWGRWIAFVLRYVQPLLVSSPPIETKPLMDVMRNRPEIIKTLMFGSEETVMAAVPIAYEVHLNYRDRLAIPELNPEQQTLFDLVKKDIQTAQDRTLTGWSRYHLDDTGATSLAYRIYAVFHGSPSATSPTLLRVLNDATKHPEEMGRKFEAYLTRAIQEPTATALVGQALGYLNEYELRQRMMWKTIRLFLQVAFFILFTLGGGSLLGYLSKSLVLSLIAAIAQLLGMIAAPILFITLGIIGYSIWADYHWNNMALNTLETLMGPDEVDPVESISPPAQDEN